MVKPRVFGHKYAMGTLVVRAGSCGFHTKAELDNMGTKELYDLLHSYNYYWSASAGQWKKDVNRAKRAALPARGVFAGIPIRQHLAVRIVAHSSQIDQQIASAKDLYELLGAVLLQTTGPVPAKRGQDKALAYLYFKLPR